MMEEPFLLNIRFVRISPDFFRKVQNVANGYNQLGKYYLYVQNFDSAKGAIEDALRRLHSLQATRRSDESIEDEIATAYFHLGDIYATLYRKSGNELDREKARSHYQKSMSIDHIRGADCSDTALRIQSLDDYK